MVLGSSPVAVTLNSMVLIFFLHHSNIFNGVLIKLAFPTRHLTVPPIPLQGLFPWEVTKKYHSALRPKPDSWWKRVENAL